MATFHAKQLPSPRLQLRWRKLKTSRRGYNWECKYELVHTLTPYDIRHEKEMEYSGKSAERKVIMGRTLTETKRTSMYWEETDLIDIPFRDGAHIRWDSAQLLLPAFVVCGDRAQFIEPAEKRTDDLCVLARAIGVGGQR